MASLPVSIAGGLNTSTTYSIQSQSGGSYGIPPSLRRIRHVRSLSILNIHLKDKGKKRNRALRTDLSILHNMNYQNNEPLLNDYQGGSIEVKRQLHAQEITSNNLFDCFYTLNEFMNLNDPFYISRAFSDLMSLQEEVDFDIPHGKAFTVNLFLKLEGHWNLLTQFHVMMSCLVSLGNDLDLIWKSIKKCTNLLLIRLSDHCYYTIPDGTVSDSVCSSLQQNYCKKMQSRAITLYHSRQPTCSYDQIMKLDNLRMCIDDLLAIKRNLCCSIKQLLNKKRKIYNYESSERLIKAEIAQLKQLLKNKEYTNISLHRHIDKLQKYQHSPISVLIDSSSNKHDLKDKCAMYLVKIDEMSISLNLEKSRISKDLLFIFPIKSYTKTSSPKKGTIYELFGIHFPLVPSKKWLVNKLLLLPRSQMSRFNALIGYMVLIIAQLSRYLRVTLTSPLRFFGSDSYIYDPTSINLKNHIFPLFITQNSTLIVRFSYGLYLLTRDIDQLFTSEGLYETNNYNILSKIKILLSYMEDYDGQFFTDQPDTSSFATSETSIESLRAGLNRTLRLQDTADHIRKHLLRES